MILFRKVLGSRRIELIPRCEECCDGLRLIDRGVDEKSLVSATGHIGELTFTIEFKMQIQRYRGFEKISNLETRLNPRSVYTHTICMH